MPAFFNFSCGSDDLKSLVATGPCAPDGGLSAYVGNGFATVQAQSPGVCRIELTFATGFTYSADVIFTLHPGGVCGGPQCTCADYLMPASGPFTVNNSSDACVATPDASTDGEGLGGEGGPSGGVDSGGDVGPEDAAEVGAASDASKGGG